MRVKMVFYDERTGEIFDEYDKPVPISPKPEGDREFVKIFSAFLKEVVKDKDLGMALRLLLYIIANLDYDSLKVAIVPKEAMEDLAISKDTYYRWLKVLLEKGYIEELATNIYRLKPYSAVKGRMSKAIETEPDF
jgi:hypothetical protein